MNMAEVLTVKSKKTGKNAQVVKSAYDAVWKDKGWEVVGETEEPRPQSAETRSQQPSPKQPQKDDK
jgi:hypothetical protein